MNDVLDLWLPQKYITQTSIGEFLKIKIIKNLCYQKYKVYSNALSVSLFKSFLDTCLFCGRILFLCTDFILEFGKNSKDPRSKINKSSFMQFLFMILLPRFVRLVSRYWKEADW